ncbi:MAG: hypothetical protein IT494_09765 [Gammaproteobacteria bacterium]|nr:hypothetical protein [Gammaproteobacteria bacterium]
MKAKLVCSVIGALCLSLVTGYSAQAAQREAQAGGTAKVTGLNPRGTPPPIPLHAMAPRLESLDGKTVYFVDDGFQGGDLLLQEMIGWFNRNMPNVKTVFRKKAGGFDGPDPALYAEIKEQGDAMIMATGH